MKIVFKNSMHYMVWAQGIFWSILGLVLSSRLILEDTLYIIPMWISTWTLMGLLTWIGKVIAQTTAMPQGMTQPEVKKGAMPSPYFQKMRS